MQLRKLLLVFLLFLLNAIPTIAQDSLFARQIIKELNSWKYGGRGYLDSGVLRAEKFIHKRLNEIGFKLSNPNYVESFYGKHPLLLFPKKILFQSENKEFYCGIHFIPSKNSPETHLKVIPCVNPEEKFYTMDEIKKKIVCLQRSKYSDLIYHKKYDSLLALEPKALIVFEKKLTHSIGNSVNKIPVIYFLESYQNAVINKNISIHYHSSLEEVQINNVVATMDGTEQPDSIIIISAHYDHLGKLGKDTYFPGANDNASGTAALMNLAKMFMEISPRYTLKFIFFSGEEAGLLGSQDYVKKLSEKERKKIRFVINLDLLGGGTDGGTVCNATEYPALFKRFESHFDFKLNKRGKAKNSDHYWFSENKIPSLFLYLQNKKEDAYPYYHDVYDDEKRIKLSGYHKAVKGVFEFVKSEMGND